MEENNNFNNEVLKENKKGKVVLLILIGVLLLGVGVAFGYFTPKLLDKKDNKEKDTTVIKDDSKEEQKETKEESKELEPNKDLELVGKKEKTITLNGNDIKLTAFYYKDEKKYHENYLLKELYFGDKKISDLGDIEMYSVNEKNDEVKTIEKNFNLNTKYGKKINDSKSDDEYYVLYDYDVSIDDECIDFYEHEDELDYSSDCETTMSEVKAYVLDKNGNILFESDNPEAWHLTIYKKEDILDRDYYTITDDESNRKKYVLYNGKSDGSNPDEEDPFYEDTNVPIEEFDRTGVEFKDKYFYSFAITNENDEQFVYDNKITIENGVLKYEHLKKYPATLEYLDGCAGQCSIEE